MKEARRVAVAGATGLVGRALVAVLCASPDVAQVHALSRRALELQHDKLTSHPVDFQALESLPALDEIYLTIGTMIRVAGSQEAFRRVDFDANLVAARAAYEAGARRVGLVSAIGASVQSRAFYSRVKGELEAALAQLPLEALVIARPSLLRGDRAALGQPGRTAETLGLRVDALLGPLVPRRWRAIAAEDVAAALARRVPLAAGREVLSSEVMQGASRRAPSYCSATKCAASSAGSPSQR